MVLTPRFSLSQTPTQLNLLIHVPFTRKISGMELIVLESHQVHFYCRPYLLRLVLPGNVVESQVTARLVDDSVHVILPKRDPDVTFPNLDLLTSLLQPSSSRPASAAVQDDSVCLLEHGYGFYRTFHAFLAWFLDNFPDLVDLPRPDETPASSRRSLREFNENLVFSQSRFRADALEGAEDDVYLAAVAFAPWWAPSPVVFAPLDATSLSFSFLSVSGHGSEPFKFGSASPAFFSRGENEQMLALKPKIPPLGFSKHQGLMACLDVVLAYVHELRACAGDWTSESAWAIRVLSPTLSWLDVFDRVEDVLVAFCRRALCFPYLRRWDLVLLACRDAHALLKSDQRNLVRALLQVRERMRKSESLYLLNRLYLDDMCCFAQTLAASDVAGLAAEVDEWLGSVQGSGFIPPKVAVGGWDLARINRLRAGLASKTNEQQQQQQQQNGEWLEALD